MFADVPYKPMFKTDFDKNRTLLASIKPRENAWMNSAAIKSGSTVKKGAMIVVAASVQQAISSCSSRLMWSNTKPHATAPKK